MTIPVKSSAAPLLPPILRGHTSPIFVPSSKNTDRPPACTPMASHSLATPPPLTGSTPTLNSNAPSPPWAWRTASPPTPPAKGKIERRFGTFQNRLVTLLAYEKITDYKNANDLLQTQIDWHNQNHVCRTTGLAPNAAWELALKEKRNHARPVPAVPLLDLHLALYLQRRLNTDYTLDFL